MKAIVLKDCLDSTGEFLAKNIIIKDFDDEKESKLIDLGLVDEYDVKKHKRVAPNKDAEIESLKEESIVKDAEIESLKEAVAKLTPKGK